MAGNLKARLTRIREAQSRSAGERQEGGEEAGKAIDGPRPTPSFLSGWERVNEFVYRRECRRPLGLPPSIDAGLFLGKAGRACAEARGAGHGVDVSTLRFFDLETTGLSGGTGTLAFLAAIGRPAGDGLSITQLFLADYPGEGLFISLVLEALGPEGTIVSYNGKAFDLPLLRTRCVLNGLEVPAALHLDLLHLSRRLWRSVHGGASLGLLEAEVLGLDRGPDVPGSRIPQLWFDFLARGESEEMELVLSHNASDVATLAALLSYECRVFEAPLDHAEDRGIDRAGLGRSLISVGRIEEGEALLEAAALAGNERAAILLSRRYGRDGRLEERRRIQEAIGASPEGMIERAKFLEHCERDYRLAMDWVLRAEKALGEGIDGEALDRRKARISKKAAMRKRGRGES